MSKSGMEWQVTEYQVALSSQYRIILRATQPEREDGGWDWLLVKSSPERKILVHRPGNESPSEAGWSALEYVREHLSFDIRAATDAMAQLPAVE
jgi:hypothetical protein